MKDYPIEQLVADVKMSEDVADGVFIPSDANEPILIHPKVGYVDAAFYGATLLCSALHAVREYPEYPELKELYVKLLAEHLL